MDDSSDELISLLSGELQRAKAQLAKIMVTEAAPGADETPERILLEVGDMSPGGMLQRYQDHMSDFDTIPIDPAGDRLRFYRGEWTIWSGFPGTGKTTLLRQTACHLLQTMKDGASVFVATLEQDPEWFLIEMAATAAGVEIPTVAQLASFLNTYGSRLKVWGIIGIADHKQILATIRHLADKHGCRHAIIDSLMCLDVDSTSNEDQRHFANLISATARAKRVHIHLVAHPRKPLAPDQAPNVWDIAGASDLGRLAYNVLFIRRGPETTCNPDISSMLLHVLKQRTKGVTGEQTGYFYRLQRQFHIDPHATEPTRYLPDDQYPASGLTEIIPEHILNPKAFRTEPTPVKMSWEDF
jgi:hypothetical protein